MASINQKPALSKKEQIKQVLTRGVEVIYPSKAALAKALNSGKKLRLYLGIDPTGADLHIGHTIALQKLRQFQDLGHEVILLVGDFTGQTGDPTDKQAIRKPMSRRQLTANAKRYKKQASSILSFTGRNAVKLVFNSQWLGKLTFDEVAELAGHFTVQQMVERDMFEERLRAGKPISLREFLYPLMQGYDSVALGVDLEIGGSDQTFNMLAGRKLAREYKEKDKFVVTVPILADSRGVKIGKTEGNAIAITGEAKELFGQIMALPDEVIVPTLECCTSVPQPEVAEVAKLTKDDPMEAKLRLAYAVVNEYQGARAAARGQDYFVKAFRKRSIPKDIAMWHPPRPVMPLWSLLKSHPTVPSSSEAHRLISQGAIKVDGKVVRDPHFEVSARQNPVIHIGKRTIIRIVR